MHLKSSLVIAATLVAGTFANASTVGFSDVYGPQGDYAIFDFFREGGGGLSGNNLVNIAPVLETEGENNRTPAQASSLFAVTLSTDMTGGSLPSGGLRIYNGVGPVSTAFNASITGTAIESITSMSLQMRVGAPDPATGLDQLTYWSNITLNGVSATGTITYLETEGDGYAVVRWSWSDLNIQANDTFAFAIEGPAVGHISVDAFRVDAIPEPSTYALVAAGIAGAAFLRRRRAA